MKILLGLLFSAYVCSLQAGELLKNGDFSEGKMHWFGDGVAPADLAPDNPLAAKNPEAAEKELVIPLNPHHWTKITQEFRTHAGQYSIVVKFKPSPDLKFSHDKDDFEKAYEDIGLWNSPSFTPVGTLLYGVIDSSKIFGLYSNYFISHLQEPNPVIQTSVNDNRTSDAKTLYVAFPPGTGNVIVQSASVTTPD